MVNQPDRRIFKERRRIITAKGGTGGINVRAELIFTGTELLTGQVLNTHGKYLSDKLSEMGIEVVLHTTVGDDWLMLAEILRTALGRSDIIIITGGLGPTTDDLTKETVARVLGLSLKLDKNIMKRLQRYFEMRGVKMPQSMVKQAYLPEGATTLDNPSGTAPGIFLKKGNKTIFILPGPPVEMKAVFEKSVITNLKKLADTGSVIKNRLFKLTGIAEATVQDELKNFSMSPKIKFAYLAKPGQVHVKATVRSKNNKEADEILKKVAEQLYARFGKHIFGENDDKLEVIVGKLLEQAGKTIGLAESCTGGMIGAFLTDVPGSSKYFLGGITAYDNSVKEKTLGVAKEVIERFGAVSRQAAESMAIGARRVLGSDLGLSVTGIAGPGGGTAEKPVGLVYIALADASSIKCKKYYLPGERLSVRRGAVNTALNLVRLYLLGMA